MRVEWYCRIMGTEMGPYSSQQLLEMAKLHRLSPEDLVQKGRGGEWVAAFRVKGLFTPEQLGDRAAPAPQPAKPSPPPPPVAEPNPRPAGSGPQVDDWYCIAAGERRGPMSLADLQVLARTGVLKRSDRVWRSSAPKWRPAIEVHELECQ